MNPYIYRLISWASRSFMSVKTHQKPRCYGIHVKALVGLLVMISSAAQAGFVLIKPNGWTVAGDESLALVHVDDVKDDWVKTLHHQGKVNNISYIVDSHTKNIYPIYPQNYASPGAIVIDSSEQEIYDFYNVSGLSEVLVSDVSTSEDLLLLDEDSEKQVVVFEEGNEDSLVFVDANAVEPRDIIVPDREYDADRPPSPGKTTESNEAVIEQRPKAAQPQRSIDNVVRIEAGTVQNNLTRLASEVVGYTIKFHGISCELIEDYTYDLPMMSSNPREKVERYARVYKFTLEWYETNKVIFARYNGPDVCAGE